MSKLTKICGTCGDQVFSYEESCPNCRSTMPKVSRIVQPEIDFHLESTPFEKVFSWIMFALAAAGLVVGILTRSWFAIYSLIFFVASGYFARNRRSAWKHEMYRLEFQGISIRQAKPTGRWITMHKTSYWFSALFGVVFFVLALSIPH